jgi:protein-ribulosamine 3-kinase
MAKVHSHKSPTGKFGFHVTTCCGSTQMPNCWESSWAEFFGTHRLQAILDEDRKVNGADQGIDELGRVCVQQVVPRLLGVLENIEPVLVHGDL